VCLFWGWGTCAEGGGEGVDVENACGSKALRRRWAVMSLGGYF
jgi:hypothetical protein